jgi:hypothetical protein
VALISAMFAYLGRSIGRILNTVFGWATTMLFGKVPQKRQILLSVLSFGSLVWLLFVIGIALPKVGGVLLAFMVPKTVAGQTWVRLVMLAGALLLPLATGFASLFLHEPHERPAGFRAKLRAAARGYRFTPALALTLLLLIAFAPLFKLGALVRRWKTEHVPMVVEPRDYAGVVAEIARALAAAGYATHPRRASWMLRLPSRLLAAVAGGTFTRLVADDLTTLRGVDLEVTLHPSDLLIRGRPPRIYGARVMVAQQLAFSNVYLTWDKEAQAFERRLRALWDEMRHQDHGSPGQIAGELEEIDVQLREQPLPYEEWEILYRKKLLVERGLLQLLLGVTGKPKEPKDRWDYAGGTTLLREALRARKLVPRLAVLGWAGLRTWLARRQRAASWLRA